MTSDTLLIPEGRDLGGKGAGEGVPPEAPRSMLDNNKNNCPQQLDFSCKEALKDFWLQGSDGSTLPFRCKQWKCRDCYERNKWRLKFIVNDIAVRHQTRYFVTLTFRRDRELDQAYKHASHSWSKFRRRYARETNKELKFIRITENHKDGYPHYHFLTHQRLDIGWLRETWIECGGGQQIRIEYVKPLRPGDSWEIAVSKYLSKYFSKAMMILPKHTRRFNTNYSYEKLKSPDGVKYTLMIKRFDGSSDLATKDDVGLAFALHEHQEVIQEIREMASRLVSNT